LPDHDSDHIIGAETFQTFENVRALRSVRQGRTESAGINYLVIAKEQIFLDIVKGGLNTLESRSPLRRNVFPPIFEECAHGIAQWNIHTVFCSGTRISVTNVSSHKACG